MPLLDVDVYFDGDVDDNYASVLSCPHQIVPVTVLLDAR